MLCNFFEGISIFSKVAGWSPTQARRNMGGRGGEGGLQPPQISAKVELLPIDNYSEKKKNRKKNTNDFKFLENFW